PGPRRRPAPSAFRGRRRLPLQGDIQPRTFAHNEAAALKEPVQSAGGQIDVRFLRRKPFQSEGGLLLGAAGPIRLGRSRSRQREGQRRQGEESGGGRWASSTC